MFFIYFIYGWFNAQNLNVLRDPLEKADVILVTSGYHAVRAINTFRHLMPEIIFISSHVPVEKSPENMIRKGYRMDFIKRWLYFIRYGISLS